MKRISLLLAACIAFLSISVSAQNPAPIEELLERLHTPTHECISSVFTPEEISILREHLGHERSAPVVDLRSGGENVYGIENVSQQYGWTSTADPGSFTPIANSPINDPDFEGAGAVNETGNLAYVIDSNNALYQLSLLTGVYTLLGVLSLPAGFNITGLEFDPTDGTLYGLASDAVTTALYVINVVTVVATLIGITGMVLGIALAASPAGELFAVDIDNDALYAINKITAIATLIGLIGFDANFGAGMALSVLSGIVLLSAFNTAVMDTELRSINLVTGLTTLIGLMIIGTVAQFAWIAAPSDNLGVAGPNGSGLFSAYPNPAGESLFLKAKQRIESISIYDMFGKRVLYQPVDAMDSEVNLSYLSSGQYICKALINGQQGVYKIVKQ